MRTLGRVLDRGCDPTTAPSPTADACAPDALATLKPGTLTIATDEPAYEPWFVDNDPANGKGYEGAFGAALADRLGFTPTQVTWVRVPFNNAVAPGEKAFDLDINQVSISPEREQAVDFSSPYYDVSQAVVTVAGSAAEGVTDLAGLASLQIGAQVGTTSLKAVEEIVKPTKEPRVYNSNDDAKLALTNGQIDALVLDLPTAFYVATAELEGGKIVGQLPAGSDAGEQFGAVLDKGSPLTGCVSEAVNALRADGTLDALAQEWLAQAAGAPVLG